MTHIKGDNENFGRSGSFEVNYFDHDLMSAPLSAKGGARVLNNASEAGRYDFARS